MHLDHRGSDMYNNGNPLHALSYNERLDLNKFLFKLNSYIVSLEEQRKTMKENKIKNIEEKLDHSMSPSNEEYYYYDSLMNKAFPQTA